MDYLGSTNIREAQPSQEFITEASNGSIPGFKETTNFRPRYSNNPTKEKKKRTIARFFSDM